MSFTATVENGAIKLPPDITLPDGTEVRIERVDDEGATQPPRTIADRYRSIIGAVKEGPADLADNLDHYLYGLPKRIL